MSTFSGDYIQEPSNLQTVCTEADLIATCDDPGSVASARDVLRFADLTSDQLAPIVVVMDSLIAPAEDLLNSYARRQGYAIPLNPLDAAAKDIAVRLCWISIRQHAKGLTADAAERQRRDIRDGALKDVAEGRLMLTATRSTATKSRESQVYSITDAASRDTTGQTPRMSRESLEGF